MKKFLFILLCLSVFLLLCGAPALAEEELTLTDIPEILDVTADEELSASWALEIEVSTGGVLTGVLEDGILVLQEAVEAGVSTCTFDWEKLSGGMHTLTLRLTDEAGVSSSAWAVDLLMTAPTQAADADAQTPGSISGVSCSHDICSWKLTLGVLDEDAIWQVLTQPVTVLQGNERHQYKVRKEPSASCTTYTGEVTYASQAVHVLEMGDEWTLIQAYSSSVEGSSVKVWAKPFTGYVETKLLQEKEVSQEVGIVIDKLQQRLYVFQNGKLLSTLLCSTGFARKDTPFNETPAGEFLAISWTGGFWSGNLYCDMAIRINDGILLHEVPCLITENADGTTTRNYDRCERYLGEKASHGCIRIQRALTAEGVNAKWLWENLPRKGAPAKVIIWDDAGRILAYPSDDLSLYYNPKGGKYYHSVADCSSVKSKYLPLTAFPYGELDNKPFASLEPCPYCNPQMRKAKIDEINKDNNSR